MFQKENLLQATDLEGLGSLRLAAELKDQVAALFKALGAYFSTNPNKEATLARAISNRAKDPVIRIGAIEHRRHSAIVT